MKTLNEKIKEAREVLARIEELERLADERELTSMEGQEFRLLQELVDEFTEAVWMGL